jgi:hypothetical protein
MQIAVPVQNGSRQQRVEFRQCIPTTSRILVGAAARQIRTELVVFKEKEKRVAAGGFRGCAQSWNTHLTHNGYEHTCKGRVFYIAQVI